MVGAVDLIPDEKRPQNNIVFTAQGSNKTPPLAPVEMFVQNVIKIAQFAPARQRLPRCRPPADDFDHRRIEAWRKLSEGRAAPEAALVSMALPTGIEPVFQP
jgi:hypothetical protein